jgi:type II secretory pathway predicted ATPase ExeA
MTSAATEPNHYYLCNILHSHQLRQSDLARFIEEQTGIAINHSSFNKFLLRRRSIKKFDAELFTITQAISTFLSNQKVPEFEVLKMWHEGTPLTPHPNSVSQDAVRKRIARDLKKMEIQKQETIQPEPQMLTPKAIAHFKVHKDPFINEVNSADDLFLHHQQRFAREQMLNAVNSATMMALIAESGAGKTQVRKSFYHAISQHETKMIIIEPQTIDKRDMTPGLILAAIVDELNLTGVPHNREALARYIQKHLKNMVAQGYKFALVFEEAHDLPDKVLKFLKRMWEWDNGFRKLLGIILIGQNELKANLHETQLQVREFSRRCHQVELYPLADSMGEYLSHKFARAGQSIDKVITPDAIQNLRKKLLGTASYGIARGSDYVDYSYPLTVNAWISNAMNLCASLGEPIITPGIIDKIKEGL